MLSARILWATALLGSSVACFAEQGTFGSYSVTVPQGWKSEYDKKEDTLLLTAPEGTHLSVVFRPGPKLVPSLTDFHESNWGVLKGYGKLDRAKDDEEAKIANDWTLRAGSGKLKMEDSTVQVMMSSLARDSSRVCMMVFYDEEKTLDANTETIGKLLVSLKAKPASR